MPCPPCRPKAGLETNPKSEISRIYMWSCYRTANSFQFLSDIREVLATAGGVILQ